MDDPYLFKVFTLTGNIFKQRKSLHSGGWYNERRDILINYIYKEKLSVAETE